jgi:anti-sigma regulatory factor (Ser/Thr protein kinase)
MESALPCHRVTLQIDNDVVELSKVVALVDAFATEHRLPRPVASAMNVSLDEILNNTISYGYRDAAKHQIMISLFLQDGFLVTEVKDDAHPFDPLAVPRAGLPKRLNERTIGGVGLKFVLGLMDDAQYERRGKFNHLRLRKRIAVWS